MSVNEMDESTVLVDFDGVIHHYRGWDGVRPKGRPIAGSKAALECFKRDGFRVVVFTARARTRSGREQVVRWLRRNGYGKPGEDVYDDVTAVKVPAVQLFDDRVTKVTANEAGGLLRSATEWWFARHAAKKQRVKDG